MSLIKYVALALLSIVAGWAQAADDKPAVVIGLSAEFGVKNSLAAQSIEKGMLLAIDEINTAGGVLGKVSKLGDSYVGLEVANGVEIQIQRSAIVQVLPKGTYK